jgi:hypothetical protein
MYDAGIDPFTKKPVRTPRNLRDRRLPRALVQFFKPENDFDAREALSQAGQTMPPESNSWPTPYTRRPC